MPFNAHAECVDEWIDQEYDVSSDGVTLKINSIEIQVYYRIFELMEAGKDIEEISEETGVPEEEIEESR